MIITIDGPVAAGKTSAAHKLVTQIPFSLLDTGAIYRSVALIARQAKLDWYDEVSMVEVAEGLTIRFRFVDGENQVWIGDQEVTEAIRQPAISEGASIVSAHPGVRNALLDLQRDQAIQRNIVAEGRDTGTVVFPDADFKFFLTASARERARRRFEELRERGLDVKLEAVLADIERRDHRDSSRAIAPLVPAPEAIVIDSSTSSLDQVVSQMLTVLSIDRKCTDSDRHNPGDC